MDFFSMLWKLVHFLTTLNKPLKYTERNFSYCAQKANSDSYKWDNVFV